MLFDPCLQESYPVDKLCLISSSRLLGHPLQAKSDGLQMCDLINMHKRVNELSVSSAVISIDIHVHGSSEDGNTSIKRGLLHFRSLFFHYWRS